MSSALIFCQRFPQWSVLCWAINGNVHLSQVNRFAASTPARKLQLGGWCPYQDMPGCSAGFIIVLGQSSLEGRLLLELIQLHKAACDHFQTWQGCTYDFKLDQEHLNRRTLVFRDVAAIIIDTLLYEMKNRLFCALPFAKPRLSGIFIKKNKNHCIKKCMIIKLFDGWYHQSTCVYLEW